MVRRKRVLLGAEWTNDEVKDLKKMLEKVGSAMKHDRNEATTVFGSRKRHSHSNDALDALNAASGSLAY